MGIFMVYVMKITWKCEVTVLLCSTPMTPTCWYCLISTSLMAVSFRPLRLASFIAWYLVDRTKACKHTSLLARPEQTGTRHLYAQYKGHSSPGKAAAFALTSGPSQRRKEFEDGELHMLALDGLVERSCLPMRSGSIQLHPYASLFWWTPLRATSDADF